MLHSNTIGFVFYINKEGMKRALLYNNALAVRIISLCILTLRAPFCLKNLINKNNCLLNFVVKTISPWVSNFGHVTTKVNVHGQKSSAEVSFLVIIFLSSQFKLCYITYRPRQFRCVLKMYLMSSNVLYFIRSFKQYLQIVDDNVHTFV
jgi:hypothetical protein